MKMLKSFRIIISMLCLILLFGSDACINGPVHSTQTQGDDVLLSLSTDKIRYKSGETVYVTAIVQNLSSNIVEFTLGNIGDLTPYIYLENNPYTSTMGLYEEGAKSRGIKPAFNTQRLQPHQKITRKVVWDQQLISNEWFQAPVGTYSIGCVLYTGQSYYEQEGFLSTRIDIQLVNSPGSVTPEEAKTIALNLPEIIKWREAHAGKNVVKTENGHYFVNWGNRWEDIDIVWVYIPENMKKNWNYYEDFLKWSPGADQASVRFVNGDWLVTMKTIFGDPPLMVKIWIGQKTGAVKDIQFFEKANN